LIYDMTMLSKVDKIRFFALFNQKIEFLSNILAYLESVNQNTSNDI